MVTFYLPCKVQESPRLLAMRRRSCPTQNLCRARRSTCLFSQHLELRTASRPGLGSLVSAARKRMREGAAGASKTGGATLTAYRGKALDPVIGISPPRLSMVLAMNEFSVPAP